MVDLLAELEVYPHGPATRASSHLRSAISGHIGQVRILAGSASPFGNDGEPSPVNRHEPIRESRMAISVDDVESLRSVLSGLSRHQPKQVSKQEAIASLVSELADELCAPGYSADDLAGLMSEKGIDINGPRCETVCGGFARSGARATSR